MEQPRRKSKKKFMEKSPLKVRALKEEKLYSPMSEYSEKNYIRKSGNIQNFQKNNIKNTYPIPVRTEIIPLNKLYSIRRQLSPKIVYRRPKNILDGDDEVQEVKVIKRRVIYNDEPNNLTRVKNIRSSTQRSLNEVNEVNYREVPTNLKKVKRCRLIPLYPKKIEKVYLSPEKNLENQQVVQEAVINSYKEQEQDQEEVQEEVQGQEQEVERKRIIKRRTYFVDVPEEVTKTRKRVTEGQILEDNNNIKYGNDERKIEGLSNKKVVYKSQNNQCFQRYYTTNYGNTSFYESKSGSGYEKNVCPQTLKIVPKEEYNYNIKEREIENVETRKELPENYKVYNTKVINNNTDTESYKVYENNSNENIKPNDNKFVGKIITQEKYYVYEDDTLDNNYLEIKKYIYPQCESCSKCEKLIEGGEVTKNTNVVKQEYCCPCREREAKELERNSYKKEKEFCCPCRKREYENNLIKEKKIITSPIQDNKYIYENVKDEKEINNNINNINIEKKEDYCTCDNNEIEENYKKIDTITQENYISNENNEIDKYRDNKNYYCNCSQENEETKYKEEKNNNIIKRKNYYNYEVNENEENKYKEENTQEEYNKDDKEKSIKINNQRIERNRYGLQEISLPTRKTKMEKVIEFVTKHPEIEERILIEQKREEENEEKGFIEVNENEVAKNEHLDNEGATNGILRNEVVRNEIVTKEVPINEVEIVEDERNSRMKRGRRCDNYRYYESVSVTKKDRLSQTRHMRRGSGINEENNNNNYIKDLSEKRYEEDKRIKYIDPLKYKNDNNIKIIKYHKKFSRDNYMEKNIPNEYINTNKNNNFTMVRQNEFEEINNEKDLQE